MKQALKNKFAYMQVYYSSVLYKKGVLATNQKEVSEIEANWDSLNGAHAGLEKELGHPDNENLLFGEDGSRDDVDKLKEQKLNRQLKINKEAMCITKLNTLILLLYIAILSVTKDITANAQSGFQNVKDCLVEQFGFTKTDSTTTLKTATPTKKESGSTQFDKKPVFELIQTINVHEAIDTSLNGIENCFWPLINLFVPPENSNKQVKNPFFIQNTFLCI